MKKLICALIAIAGLFSQTAQASLIGETVDCASNGFFLGCSPASNTVGAGIEFIVEANAPDYQWSLDITENTITFLDLSPGWSRGGHGQIFLTGFDNVEILGIANFFTTAESGIEASDISFTASSITIDALNSNWNPQEYLTFEVLMSSRDIPEPTSLLLFGLGLLGLRASRKAAR